MIFITHLRFRRRTQAAVLPFRMWGFPWTTVTGASLMLAALLTTAFTKVFRPTLLYGVSLLLLLSAAYQLRSRRMKKDRIQLNPEQAPQEISL